MTIEEVLRWARRRLGGGDVGRVDAEVLLGHCTGESAAALVAGARRCVPCGQAAAFQKLVERRARGMPVAYLTGRKEFWSLTLSVTPDVLIPRAETELLVERILAHAARRDLMTALELGTGSGAVALALASELPGCAIVATDCSSAALEVAEHNRRHLASARRELAPVEFCAGRWFDAVAARRFDLIAANPPYVAADDAHLQRGDLRFEPKAALVSRRNGMADLALIIAGAPAHLNAGGALLLEHGYDQAAAVRALFARHGFTAIATHRDLGGHERVTEGRRGAGRLPAGKSEQPVDSDDKAH